MFGSLNDLMELLQGFSTTCSNVVPEVTTTVTETAQTCADGIGSLFSIFGGCASFLSQCLSFFGK
ncbi:MAG: hypothetical protein LBB67_03660 [Oscillospiraceae bacterium]|jgi:hypothetical protein|nr:hypothetical protein [Oscillospiraceae bacterium]